MTEQFPVSISRKMSIAKEHATPQGVVPALIADLGEESSWRHTQFFTADIRSPNTRRA